VLIADHVEARLELGFEVNRIYVESRFCVLVKFLKKTIIGIKLKNRPEV
jgi:hypothetical protein